MYVGSHAPIELQFLLIPKLVTKEMEEAQFNILYKSVTWSFDTTIRAYSPTKLLFIRKSIIDGRGTTQNFIRYSTLLQLVND